MPFLAGFGGKLIGKGRRCRQPFYAFYSKKPVLNGTGQDGNIDKKLPLITLAPGSLVLFDAEFNSTYKHGIAEDRSVTEPRISLTYRAFDTAAESPAGGDYF